MSGESPTERLSADAEGFSTAEEHAPAVRRSPLVALGSSYHIGTPDLRLLNGRRANKDVDASVICWFDSFVWPAR